jgi:hypothetical protein
MPDVFCAHGVFLPVMVDMEATIAVLHRPPSHALSEQKSCRKRQTSASGRLGMKLQVRFG